MKYYKTKTIWQREYKWRRKTYSIRKYFYEIKGVDRDIWYEVSKSKKRTSWYWDFDNYDDAVIFAHGLFENSGLLTD